MHPTDATPIRILVADDSEDLRLLLRLTLAHGSRCEIVGEATDGKRAVDLVGELHPDVALVDLAMPVMDGLEAIPLMRERSPRTKYLILSGFEQARMQQQVDACGADAYVQKGSGLGYLIAVIEGLCPT